MKRGIVVSRRVRGVSLVELMVSLAIGLFLVLGATVIYVNSRKTSDVDESIARLHETARYALSVVESDARMANYWGAFKGGGNFTNKWNQLLNSDPPQKFIDSTKAAECGALFAIETEKYVDATNNEFKLSCAAKTGELSADTLTIRRAAMTPATLDANKLQACVSRNNATLVRGSACPNELRDLLVHTYYIDKGSDQNASYPSLRRKTLISGPDFQDVEVIPGVEDMQVEIGWGSGDSGQVVQYVQPENAVLAGGQIVAVRVWLLIRSETPDASHVDKKTYEYGDRRKATGTTTTLEGASARGKAYVPNDNFRRQLVSRTIFIRNAIGT